jgi:hypothetical protein
MAIEIFQNKLNIFKQAQIIIKSISSKINQGTTNASLKTACKGISN